MNLKEIQKLSLDEKKNLLERTIKLQEETGDVTLVALSIFFLEGGTPPELLKVLKEKAKKWKKFQVKK